MLGGSRLGFSSIQNSFKNSVKVGNWAEDRELDAERMRDFLYRKETGQLLVHTIQSQLAASLAETALSYSEDGYLHIGDSVVLLNAKTEGALAVDMVDDIKSDHGYTLTTSTVTRGHVARNTFVIEGVDSNAKPGSIIKYGQNIRLRVHPSLSKQNLVMRSQPASHLVSSRITRKQLVTMIEDDSQDSLWTFQHRNAAVRLEEEGQPIPANTEVIVQHLKTRQNLSSDFHKMANDFGTEYEVCGYSQLTVGKKSSLMAEQSGRPAPARSELLTNSWIILTAERPDELQEGAAIEERSPRE